MLFKQYTQNCRGQVRTVVAYVVSKVRMTLALLKDVWVSINKWVLSEQLVNIVGNI